MCKLELYTQDVLWSNFLFGLPNLGAGLAIQLEERPDLISGEGGARGQCEVLEVGQVHPPV